VRAVALQKSANGTYWNISQGVFAGPSAARHPEEEAR
jgi:hypothetical protein